MFKVPLTSTPKKNSTANQQTLLRLSHVYSFVKVEQSTLQSVPQLYNTELTSLSFWAMRGLDTEYHKRLNYSEISFTWVRHQINGIYVSPMRLHQTEYRCTHVLGTWHYLSHPCPLFDVQTLMFQTIGLMHVWMDHHHKQITTTIIDMKTAT